MKRIAGILLVMMFGVVLSGCYSKACDYPTDYKGEMVKSGKMR